METEATPKTKPTSRLTWALRIVVGAMTLAVLVGAAAYGWARFGTPAAIRQPQHEHEHLRLQIINGGAPVSFTGEAFQTPYDKDMCSAELTKEPIHFHDKLDQFAHFHWKGMTGGLLLKHYGWNHIGGLPGALGYRFDTGSGPQRVPIHGNALPKPAGKNYYVYTGDQTGFSERSWDEFLHQDLQSFLKGTPGSHLSWWQRLVPAALAHDGHDHNADAADEAERLRINNVIGNVVIFVQDQKPTDDQVRDRFAQLIDLPESSCGG